MIELLLLDPITGKPVIAGGKKIPINAKADDYLNILLLFVGYPKNAIVETVMADREPLLQQLYQTHPFFAYRDKVNVFTPTTNPTLTEIGLTLGPGDRHIGVDFSNIEKLGDTIKQYQYGSFIIKGDIWLTKKWNRSSGCVGIFYGGTDKGKKGVFRYLGLSFKKPNSTVYTLHPKAPSRFVASSTTPSIIDSDLRKKELTATFLHELGHALNLTEEYESEINSNNNGFSSFPEDLEGRLFPPNTVKKGEIMLSTSPKTVGIFPTAQQIDPKKIPWEVLLGDFQGISNVEKESLLKLRRHKSRLPVPNPPNPSTHCKQPSNFDSNLALCKEHDPRIFDTSQSPDTELRIGLFEGGDAKSFDVFRAQETCRMRHSQVQNRSYCWVCQNWIRYRINTTEFSGNADSIRKSFKKWLKEDLLTNITHVIRDDENIGP